MQDESRHRAVASDYQRLVEEARRALRDRDFDAAQTQLDRALASEEARPEAHNLVGVVAYVRGDRLAAQKHWRLALAHDPMYAPAQHNLTRSTHGPIFRGPLDLGDEVEGTGPS